MEEKTTGRVERMGIEREGCFGNDRAIQRRWKFFFGKGLGTKYGRDFTGRVSSEKLYLVPFRILIIIILFLLCI